MESFQVSAPDATEDGAGNGRICMRRLAGGSSLMQLARRPADGEAARRNTGAGESIDKAIRLPIED